MVKVGDKVIGPKGAKAIVIGTTDDAIRIKYREHSSVLVPKARFEDGVYQILKKILNISKADGVKQ